MFVFAIPAVYTSKFCVGIDVDLEHLLIMLINSSGHVWPTQSPTLYLPGK